MSKKEKDIPLDEEKEAQAPPAEEAAPDAPGGESETFTVTREQMEQMEGLAGQLAAQNDKYLRRQLAAQNDKYLRLAAEYDNYRKRTAKEKESIYQDARLDTVEKFLEVYDNLERAVQQAGGEENVHKKGMEMIFHQLVAVLEKMGVTILDPMGEAFDPERHEAVMHIDSEELGESVVSQVFQKGFLLGEKVIRFARVQVAN